MTQESSILWLSCTYREFCAHHFVYDTIIIFQNFDEYVVHVYVSGSIVMPTHVQWNHLSHSSHPIHISLSAVSSSKIAWHTPHLYCSCTVCLHLRRVLAAFAAPSFQFLHFLQMWNPYVYILDWKQHSFSKGLHCDISQLWICMKRFLNLCWGWQYWFQFWIWDELLSTNPRTFSTFLVSPRPSSIWNREGNICQRWSSRKPCKHLSTHTARFLSTWVDAIVIKATHQEEHILTRQSHQSCYAVKHSKPHWRDCTAHLSCSFLTFEPLTKILSWSRILDESAPLKRWMTVSPHGHLFT